MFGLLKKALADAIDRGMHFYIIHLDFDRERIEYRLAKLVIRRGAIVQPGGWVGGQLRALLMGYRIAVKEQAAAAQVIPAPAGGILKPDGVN